MNNPNFEKHIGEANEYLKILAADVGHPREKFLDHYLSEGQMENIKGQMPKEIHSLFA